MSEWVSALHLTTGICVAGVGELMGVCVCVCVCVGGGSVDG